MSGTENQAGRRPLRVVHVVLSMDVGGLERVVLNLVRAGQALGQQVSVICVEKRGALEPQLQALGAPVLCADKQPGLKWRTIGVLKKLLGELQPDVVHTHQIGALFYAGPAARRVRILAVLHTEHGKHYAARFRTRLLGRLATRYAGRFIAVNRDIADEATRCRVVAADKVHVVTNGIDLQSFADQRPEGIAEVRAELGIPAGARIIGTVGRLDEIKCQDLLLRAVATLRRQLPDVHAVLVGDGPLMADLRSLATRLGLAECTHFTGYTAQPQRYLRLMDIFALTSRSEGMPLAILEAWAAGLPVVASRVGGLPALIEEGKTGVLFPSGDEASLAARMYALLTDTALAARLGMAGRQRVEADFTVERMAVDYQQHYYALLERAGQRWVSQTDRVAEQALAR